MNRIASCLFFICLASSVAVGTPLPVSDAALEAFLDLPAGSLDALSLEQFPPGGDVNSGSAVKLSLTVQQGDVFSAELNFLTDETFFSEDPTVLAVIDDVPDGVDPITPGTNFNDFLFVSIVADGVLEVLESVNSSDLFFSDSTFDSETGFITFTHQFDFDGEVSVAFGVVDVDDPIVNSAFLLDELQLNGELLPDGDFELGFPVGLSTIGNVSVVPEALTGESDFFDDSEGDGELEFADDPDDGLAIAQALNAGGLFLEVSTAGFVPEPSGIALIGLGTLWVARRHRR